jgi:long-chain acyl-CoA synthetase
MILGPSGQNIYPDEIESMLNNQFAVGESLVVQRNGKLIALIYPDQDAVQKHNITAEMLKKLFERHLKVINRKVPRYMKLAGFEMQESEFVKTPKRSIKRFLYS